MTQRSYLFSSHIDMERHLRGGIKAGVRPKTVRGRVYGLDGLTLEFTAPAKTVTFSDPTGEGLSLLDIVNQILTDIDTPAVTTEGTVDLIAAFPALTNETVIVAVSDGGDVVVTLDSPADQAALLTQINAVTSLVGVTASVGTGTPNGLVLTSGPGVTSIQVKAGTANAALGIITETVAADAYQATMQLDSLTVVELVPTNGVALDAASSTAAAIFGLTGTISNAPYAPKGGVAPRFLEWTVTSQREGYLLLTEEP